MSSILMGVRLLRSLSFSNFSLTSSSLGVGGTLVYISTRSKEQMEMFGGMNMSLSLLTRYMLSLMWWGVLPTSGLRMRPHFCLGGDGAAARDDRAESYASTESYASNTTVKLPL